MASNAVVILSDSTFDQEVLKSKIPVLVDFWATWCGPCIRLAPVIDELAAENAGKVKVCKVDVDESQQAAVTYAVQSIPTLILFKDGEMVERIVGGVPKRVLQEAINKHV